MRADVFFKEKFGSRTKAAEAIERGLVLVNGKQIRAKDEIRESDEITFVLPKEQYVSNGGYKLARAKEAFSLDFGSLVCVDLGASTGGFTDCMLQNGAKKVYAVDVGECLLNEKLVVNEKVVVMDRTNARYLQKTAFLEPIDVVVTDVSFISLRLIFPTINEILSENGFAVALIKPQFESENKNIGKSGIVSGVYHAKIVEKVLGYAEENGLFALGITNAPIRKGKNVEYVVLLKKQPQNGVNKAKIVEKVKELVSLNADNLLL
ncbi:MAG: TlyA family RNA methyltransferase [Clostridia bacterium]|nr:TlyA family RNA methyltransferase [Clostridia bacterium]